MEMSTIVAATFGSLFAALKAFNNPAIAGPSAETRTNKYHDDLLETKARELGALERSKYLEECVGPIQAEFESRLESTIFWREAYIYRQLMSKWFRALCEKYRYDRVMLDNARSDWLNYLFLLEQASTSRLLSIRSNSHHLRESYGLRASNALRSYMKIEDAFAGEIGKEAIRMLQRVREKPDDAFDRSGKEEMAPDGFHYFCVSFSPFKEELRPK